MSKKIMALVLALAMVFSTITVAFAEEPVAEAVAEEVAEVSAEAKALGTIGMLEGAGDGLTAEYTATELNRLTAAIMILKLKGLYEDALKYDGVNNFVDAEELKWEDGKKILAYVKDNPVGFGGNEKGEFKPYDTLSEQMLYKVLLENLGYKQVTADVADGDFAWEETLEFAEELGLKPAKAEKFTVDGLSKAVVAALKTNIKGGKAWIEVLVDAGKVDKEKAIAAELMEEAPVVTAALKSAKAIGNTVVEVTFDAEINEGAADAALYTIEGLEVKDAVVAGEKVVRLETAAQTTGKVYILTVGEVAVKFAGVAKVTGAPKFEKAAGTDEQTVELTFDKNLDFASATNVENYTIANVKVVEAELDGKVVTLTTEGLVANKTYTVKVANISSVDGGLLKSASRSFVAKTDKTAPKLEKVEVMTNTRLLVTFNEDVTEESATDLANYSIKVGDTELAIEKIEMVEDDQVEITTASQTSGKKYELIVNNIVDTKVLANTMTKEAKKTFYGKAVDKAAPTFKKMTYLSKTLIQVDFDDKSRLALDSVLDANNYELNNDITVESVKMKDADDADCLSVILEVSEMTVGKSYKLTISDIADEYGNTMEKSVYKTLQLKADDLTAAKVKAVKAHDKTVEITFEGKELAKSSAENISNYSINNDVLVPAKAEYKASTNKVTLTTGVALTAGKSYKLTIDGLEDLAGNVIKVTPSFIASATSIDTEAPTVEGVEMLNEKVIAVTFSEPMKVGGTIKVNNNTLTAVDSNDDDTILYFVNATGGNATALNVKDGSGNQLEKVAVEYTNTLKDKASNELVVTDDLLTEEEEGVAAEYKEVYVNTEPIDDIVFEGLEQTTVREFKLIFSGKVVIPPSAGVLSVSDATYASSATIPLSRDTDDYTIVYTDYNFTSGKNYRLDLSGFKGLLGEKVKGEDEATDKKQYVDLYAGLEDEDAPFIVNVTALTRTKVEVEYNEELRTGSMTFEIRDEDDKVFDRVPGEVASLADKKVTLNLKYKLEAGKAYTLIAKGQFRDLSNNPSEKDEEFSFEGTNVVTNEYATVSVVNENIIKVALNEAKISKVVLTGGQGSYKLTGQTFDAIVYNSDGTVKTPGDFDSAKSVEITLNGTDKLYEGGTYKATVNDTFEVEFDGFVAKTDAMVAEDEVIAKIVVAEESKLQADVNAAQEAIDKFGIDYPTETTVKTALQDRLDAVQDIIDADADIAAAKAKVVDVTVDDGDNLITNLEALVDDATVTLKVKAEVTGTNGAKVGVDGTVTEGTAEDTLEVIIVIEKAPGATVEKTINVTVTFVGP